MKPDLQFSILCEDVRQERSGAFCFIGVTGVIRGVRFPHRVGQIFVVNGWCKGVGKYSQKIKIIARENDKSIFGSDKIEFSLKDLNDKRVIITQFQNVLIPSPGDYSVEISLNEDLKLAYPLVVQKVRMKGMPYPGDQKN